MGRLNYFLSGTLVGGVLILNQVYENERLKETIHNNQLERQRINSMVPLCNDNLYRTSLSLQLSDTITRNRASAR